MPRIYIQKNMRKQWTTDAMAAAITAVRNKEMGYLKASKTFGVPRATLERKVKCIDAPLSEVVNVPLGRKPILSPHIEAELVSYITEMESRLFGVTCTDVRRMAYQLAKKNNIKTNFNIDNEMAGKDWLASFLTRHPQLSLQEEQCMQCVSCNKWWHTKCAAAESADIKMAKVQVAAFITTNVDSKSINESFLSSCSIMVSKLFYTDVQYVTLELQTNVTMMRAASIAPMLNLKLFHNSDKVDNSSKHDLAKQVASWFAKHLRIPEDRVLVLFIDTRLCNAE